MRIALSVSCNVSRIFIGSQEGNLSFFLDVLPCMDFVVKYTEIETLIENMEDVLLNDVIDANAKLVMKIIFLMYFICSNNTDQ